MKIFTTLPLLFVLFAGHAQTDSISVYFDFDSDVISIKSKKALSELKETAELTDHMLFFNEARAYTDKSGSESYNLDLAKRRMSAVTAIQGGIKKQTIVGENHNSPNSGKDPNFRRVDIFYELVGPPLVADAAEKIPEPVEKPQNDAQMSQPLESFLKDSTQKEVTIVLSIEFFPGTDALINQNDPQLWALFDFLKDYPKISAEIRGHVCCGPQMELSISRAKVVYDFLTERAISTNRLIYKGYSNTMPLASPELTSEDQQRNRRVDVVFFK